MKIAVIRASSQKEKNEILYNSVLKAAAQEKDQVINFGTFEGKNISYSYIKTPVLISLLYESGAFDFTVTGCSPGQGMVLACNSLPGLICGHV